MALTINQSDRIFAALVPAVLLVLATWWFYIRPLNVETQAREDEMAEWGDAEALRLEVETRKAELAALSKPSDNPASGSRGAQSETVARTSSERRRAVASAFREEGIKLGKAEWDSSTRNALSDTAQTCSFTAQATYPQMEKAVMRLAEKDFADVKVVSLQFQPLPKEAAGALAWEVKVEL